MVVAEAQGAGQAVRGGGGGTAITLSDGLALAVAAVSRSN
jgi:hypothetical protein